MKNAIVLMCSLLLFGINTSGSSMIPESQSSENSIRLWCSPDLQEVVGSFVETYRSSHANTDISMNILEDGAASVYIGQSGNIAILTKDEMAGLDTRLARMNVIGREIYVPIMNKNNPYRKEILEQGISPREFAMLYSAGENAEWDGVFKDGDKQIVKPYRVDDASFTAYLSEFIMQDRQAVQGRVLGTCEDVMQAVMKDKNAIGFCTLAQLKAIEDAGVAMDIAMIPVDLNDNNELDHFEAIYGSVDELSRGVWIGKYSGSLYTRIFAVSSLGVLTSAEQELLKWISDEGQNILAVRGYSTLLLAEKEAILANLENAGMQSEVQQVHPHRASFGIILISVILGAGILLFIVLLIFNQKEPVLEKKGSLLHTPKNGAQVEIPGGYLFDSSHTWSFLEKDGRIRIGVDNFLQKATGAITKIELKSPGESVKKGESIVALIQNGKKLEIKSPLSGTVSIQNSQLRSNASLINSSPFSEGWIYLIQPSKWTEEVGSFFNSSRYGDWLKSEITRLKDFLAGIILPEGKAELVLQDGGELVDNVLEHLGPDVWEEFQTGFLKN